MRSLDDIFEGQRSIVTGITREILFEDGKWCMYRRLNIGSERALIVHRCACVRYALGYIDSATEKDLTWVCGGNQPEGSGCGEKTPIELRGLWYLYRWEK